MTQAYALILILLLTSSGTCMTRNDNQVKQQLFVFYSAWHRLICKTINTGTIKHFMGTIAKDTRRSKDSPNYKPVTVNCQNNLKIINK